jgi:hypothetical protein
MKNILVTIMLSFLFCSTLVSEDSEHTRKALKGLTGIRVVVDYFDPNDAEKDGLSRDQIRTDVELRLRTAGIKVLTEEKSLEAPGMPLLRVKIMNFKHNTYGLYSLSLNISLAQRYPQGSVTDNTWTTKYIEPVGATNISQVLDKIKDSVDIFINAWLSVNPK